MAITGAFCSDDQLREALNTNEVDTCLKDGRETDSPATIDARSLAMRKKASRLILGILKVHPKYAQDSTLDLSTYEEGSGVQAIAEEISADLAADFTRRRNPAREIEPVPPDHPSYMYARLVVKNEAVL